MATRILIADEQRIMRDGLRHILEARPGFDVVGEATDGEEAVRLCAEQRPDLLLHEMQLPRLSGISVIERVRREAPDTRCLVLSARQGGGWLEEAMRAGAAGYLPKAAGVDELLQAIEVVGSGRFYFSPSLTNYVVEAFTRKSGAPGSQLSQLSQLTRREREVLQLIGEGLSTKEIASRLGVSPKTADSHRAGLMEKVGIHKSVGLVRLAIREGLVVA